jgi:hypothetical protein
MSQSYQWPCPPFEQQHWINGTFCENRPSGSIERHHFHDGVDIHLPQGNNVYSVIDGVVDGIGTADVYGINAYVRVGRYAYVHVDPNPNLDIGDPVIAFETILGTTNSWNHIHFKDGWPGNEINALRSNGGLTPFADEYTPAIDYVDFYVNNSTIKFTNNRIFGKVDIVAKARDKSDDGPVGDNNGIYKIGYQIYDATAANIVSAPIQNFVFSNIPPSDSYITNVYFQGSDVSNYLYTITNQITSDKYWDTDLLEKGVYQVRIFTEDTRFNTKEVWETVQVVKPDNASPATPQFLSFLGDNANHWILQWQKNDSSDVAGYTLSFSLDGENWSVQTGISDELTPQDTTLTYGPFANNSLLYLRLNAYDKAAFTNYSDSSDAYGIWLSEKGAEVLIVDGFDRVNGYWQKSSHTFAIKYGNILAELGLSFNTCSDDVIRSGEVRLDDYKTVIYLLGDESGEEKALNEEEQNYIQHYLQNGGNLIISGSDIGNDLYAQGSESDREFYQTFLRANFISDSAGSYQQTGQSGTVFENFACEINPPSGGKYKSDIIAPVSSERILNFANGQVSGIYFSGLFPNGIMPGHLAYFAFPIELISDYQERAGLIGRVLGLFGVVSSIDPGEVSIGITKAYLSDNYPNPFNPITTINYHLPTRNYVDLSVYNQLGQKVATLIAKEQVSGTYQVKWNAENFTSGVYYYRLKAGEFVITKKMLLLK